VRRQLYLVAAAVSLLLVAATPAGAATRQPLPAGTTPSPISKMVCSKKAQHEIAEVLGVTASVQTPTWLRHLYACNYRYPSGTMTLSVKELSSWAGTFAYYRALGKELGFGRKLQNLGQGAFTTGNGSVVVRKDWKVLLVQIAKLPAQFGRPATSSKDVAFTVADLILGCWNGD